MANIFDSSSPGLTGISGKPLTSGEWSVGTNFTNACHYLYIGAAGDLTVARASDGAAVTYKNIPAGITLFVGCRQVVATTIPSPTNNIVPHE